MQEHPSPSRGSAVTRSDKLSNYGWGEAAARSLAASASVDGFPARVIRADRIGCLVVTGNGLEPCHVPKEQAGADAERWPPTTGDWVIVRSEPGFGLVVCAVAPRYSALHRSDPSETGRQVLAVNLDTVFVIHGLDRPTKLGRIERFLVMVWDGAATPVVVLTKSDLVSDSAVVERRVEMEAAAGGVEVVVVSSATGAGLNALGPHLQSGRTVALVGESGVGKSTLANRLAGVDHMATGTTRRDAKGRHTTAVREMVPLPGGAVLIDTPGLRAVGLWAGDHGIDHVFGDIDELSSACRFRDCRHSVEPDCAVRAAVESGVLPERRLDSYRKLQRELAYVELRNDVRARAEEKAAGRRYRASRRDLPQR